MSGASAEAEFLAAEYDQPWDHYRHTETQRLQYLGYFFTVSLGSAALAGPVLSSAGPDTESRTIAVALFMAVFQTSTYFVFLSVHRFGAVLEHYLQAMVLLRRRRAELANVDDPFATILNTRESPRLASMGTPFRVQAAAERILFAALMLGAAISAGALAVAAAGLRWPAALTAVAVACCLLSTAWALITSCIALRARRSIG